MRPITQPDGTAEFNEVFFDDARCPKDNVVGGVNNGWVVANTTLAHERGMSATTSYRRFEEELDQMVAAAREQRQRSPTRSSASGWPRYYTKIQILRINGLRVADAPRSTGARTRHRGARRHQQDVLVRDAPRRDGAGPRHLRRRRHARRRRPGHGSWPGSAAPRGRERYPVSPMVSAFFFSRSETIWGGTAEIQRNIVGERVLGLPKEPKPA